MSTEQPAPAADAAPLTPPDGVTPAPPSGGPHEPDDGPATFDREYVQKLREEAAGHRVRAKRADALGARLVTAYAAATGRLADPSDLPPSDELLDDDGLVDPDKVRAAVDALLERKPHLASRRPVGDVGQGALGADTGTVSLAGLLRAGAG